MHTSSLYSKLSCPFHYVKKSTPASTDSSRV